MTTEKRFRWHVINDHIRNIPNPVGAEIGVHRGECSGHLLQLHPGLKLYMIDMWSPDTYKGKGDDAATEPYRKIYEKECDLNRKKAIEAVEPYKDRAIIIQSSSIIASAFFDDNSLDFVFIDGAHDEESVSDDIECWSKKIKNNGWIIGHDYSNFEGVKKAVDKIFNNIIIDEDYTWSVQLKNGNNL